MELVLYSTNDMENVLNKTLIEKYRFNIKMKNDVDLLTPTIVLNDKGLMNFRGCNYCYIEEFKRYYFVRTIENVNSHIWSLFMECDVLESFKTDILNSQVIVKRSIHEGDYYLENAKVEVLRDVTTYNSNVTLVEGQQHLLSTIGGV